MQKICMSSKLAAATRQESIRAFRWGLLTTLALARRAEGWHDNIVTGIRDVVLGPGGSSAGWQVLLILKREQHHYLHTCNLIEAD